jgi:hypothetical protein
VADGTSKKKKIIIKPENFNEILMKFSRISFYFSMEENS